MATSSASSGSHASQEKHAHLLDSEAAADIGLKRQRSESTPSIVLSDENSSASSLLLHVGSDVGEDDVEMTDAPSVAHGNGLLQPPSCGKMHLISPPGSPPVGWEQAREEAPNMDPLAEDIAADAFQVPNDELDLTAVTSKLASLLKHEKVSSPEMSSPGSPEAAEAEAATTAAATKAEHRSKLLKLRLDSVTNKYKPGLAGSATGGLASAVPITTPMSPAPFILGSPVVTSHMSSHEMHLNGHSEPAPQQYQHPHQHQPHGLFFSSSNMLYADPEGESDADAAGSSYAESVMSSASAAAQQGHSRSLPRSNSLTTVIIPQISAPTDADLPLILVQDHSVISEEDVKTTVRSPDMMPQPARSDSLSAVGISDNELPVDRDVLPKCTTRSRLGGIPHTRMPPLPQHNAPKTDAQAAALRTRTM
ncbi:hypothetical protein RI367_002668 [Sorochytrium milnesiophthora]